MGSYVIGALIVVYMIYVIRKKIKDIKSGTCCSCSGGSTCKNSCLKKGK